MNLRCLKKEDRRRKRRWEESKGQENLGDVKTKEWKRTKRWRGKGEKDVKTKKLLCGISSFEEMTKPDHFLFQPPGCLDTAVRNSRQRGAVNVPRHRWRSEAFSTDCETLCAKWEQNTTCFTCVFASLSHVQLQTLGNVSTTYKGQIVTFSQHKTESYRDTAERRSRPRLQ